MNGFKECSSCGTLYTKSCGCSKGGFVNKFVHDPNKTPDSSQRPPHECLKCGNPVDGLHCRQCALLRKKLKEVWFTICDEHKLFQDFLNISESSNDDSNVVNALQEPIVFNQDTDKNYSQSPPHIDHHCCYRCGDSLDDQVVNLDSYTPKPLQCQKIPIYYGNDDDEESSTLLRDIIISELPLCFAITPVLSTKETKDSLIMGDEHLDTIPEKESDELIESSVKNLVPNPSESEDLSSIGQSLLNQDSSIISSSKIDSLLDEFAGELIFLKSIPSGIDEVDCDPEEEIRLIKKLFYDNSSPHPLKEFNSKISDAVIESFSPSPIPIEDSDSLMEEINLSLTPDDSMPSDIKYDDYDSEGDILILEELLRNDSLLLPENESFHFDIPSSPRPPAKPPDNDNIEPDSRSLTVKLVGDISEHYVLMPRIFPTQPTLASNEEKSPHLLSHRGFNAFKLSSESQMMIYGGNIPILDVPMFHFYPH
nr:hypothetical protein [Tanacetum cinerariifolium]